jgi:Mg-chelatase subunit ChlD
LRFGSDATAVAIALDASGSMQGERMYSAVGACLMILEALRGAHGSESYLYAFHGHHNASMAVAKAWEELVSVGERKLLTLAPSGGTPILTAVAHGINALKTRRAGRRVLLVVTDGDLREWDHLRELSATAKRMGIAVIGVGIGQALGRGFPLCIRVDKLGDLGGSAMALLTQALRREFPVDQAEE